jgi:hypothetical protein
MAEKIAKKTVGENRKVVGVVFLLALTARRTNLLRQAGYPGVSLLAVRVCRVKAENGASISFRPQIWTSVSGQYRCSTASVEQIRKETAPGPAAERSE